MHTGHWDDVLEAAAATNETYRPYITIQVSRYRLHSSITIIAFGLACSFRQFYRYEGLRYLYNQLRNIFLKLSFSSLVTTTRRHSGSEIFKTNLAQMAADANAANAIPILVTSFTRRDWNKTTDSVVKNLKDWVAAIREVARANKVRLVDLNAVSMKYINAIGHENADEYNLSASDEAHLNTHGETLFGNMMANLIASSTSNDLGNDTSSYLNPDSEIIAAIEDRTFILS